MTAAVLDCIILGHNPFFGVDHLSQERGNEKAKQFDATDRVVEFLRECHDLGVRGLMLSTHPKVPGVLEGMGRDAGLAGWRLYPLVPYINKYVRGANEKGLVHLALEVLGQTSLAQKFSLMLQGGRGLLGRDFRQTIGLFLDVELMWFDRRRLGAVFLHDALTDLALGLGLDGVFEQYREHVERHYGVAAGLTTKNVPRLRERLDHLGWKDPLVMASFNAAGFSMNPSARACAEAVARPGLTFVAMNTLASGQLRPDDAYAWLAKFPAVRSVVVGVSRRAHAEETVGAITRHLGPNAARA